jgi:hypothetical protein
VPIQGFMLAPKETTFKETHAQINYFQGDSCPFKETHAQGDSLRRAQGESSLAARLERARRGHRERERLEGTDQERELAKRMVS